MPDDFARHLRALPDDGLASLLQLRPDLAVPVPPDTQALAARAQSVPSVGRALDDLDRFTLEILDALRLIRYDGGVASTQTLLALTAQAKVPPDKVRAALDRLRARMLIFGPDSELVLTAAIDNLMSRHPLGLGRPAEDLDPDAAELVSDPARLRRTVISAPPEARAVLDRLAAGPPVGIVPPDILWQWHTARDDETTEDEITDGEITDDGLTEDETAEDQTTEHQTTDDQTTDHQTPGTGDLNTAPGNGGGPVRWLVDRHLLVAVGADTVELPREVALLLRRDTGPLGVLHPDPPPMETVLRPGADSAGAGQALEAVRHLDAALTRLAETPALVLRSGGLGVRDLRRLARDTGVTEATAALLLEVAYAAGLLNQTEPSRAPSARVRTAVSAPTDACWLPTGRYDLWRAAGLAQRWALLARAWWEMPRAPSAVGQRADRDRAINVLSEEVNQPRASLARRLALSMLAELAPTAAASADAVLDQLAWRWPRRLGSGAPGGLAPLVRAALAEAAVLGVTGLDALTTFGRELLAECGEGLGEVGVRTAGSAGPGPDHRSDDDPLGVRNTGDEPDRVAAALAAHLPQPVAHFLVQADLTVVVPGPPAPWLAAELDAVADAESRGGATVYRVTPASVRRALDAGYAVEDVLALFQRRSSTPLPQALTYLIGDVARRHGGLRVGGTGSYLRSEDEALLSEVLAHRALSKLGLRRLAPTVLAAPVPAARLLRALRDAGYAPVEEDALGATVVARATPARAPARAATRSRKALPPKPLHGPKLAGVVEQIRLGDRRAQARKRLDAGVAAINRRTGAGTQAFTEALAALRDALRERARVWVSYVDSHGSPAARLVRPVSIGAGFLRAEDDRTDTLHTFALHRITSAIRDDR